MQILPEGSESVTKYRRSFDDEVHCNILQHPAICCDTLQHTAAHRGTLQLSAAHCNTLQHTAIHCNTLQYTAPYYTTMSDTAPHYPTMQHTATHCNTLQHTSTHCNTLQHTATHCNTMQHTAAAYCSTLQLSSTRDIYIVYTFTPHTQLLLAATGICSAAAACANCNRHGTRGPWQNISPRLSARHLSRLGRSRRYATESTCPYFAHPGYVSLTLDMYLSLHRYVSLTLHLGVFLCFVHPKYVSFCTLHTLYPFAYSVFQDVCWNSQRGSDSLPAETTRTKIVMQRTQMSHVTHAWMIQDPCYTYEWVMSHMSVDIHSHTSVDTCVSVVSYLNVIDISWKWYVSVWVMNYVSHMSHIKWRHTCERSSLIRECQWCHVVTRECGWWAMWVICHILGGDTRVSVGVSYVSGSDVSCVWHASVGDELCESYVTY